MISNRSRLALAAFGVSAALAVAVPFSVGAQPAAPRQLPANPPPPRDNQQYDRGDPRGYGYERRETRLSAGWLPAHGAAHTQLSSGYGTISPTRCAKKPILRGRGPAEGPTGPDRRDDPRAQDTGRPAPRAWSSALSAAAESAAGRAYRSSARHGASALCLQRGRRAADEHFRPNGGRGDRFTMGGRGDRPRPFDRRYGPFNRPY